jgi:hypothetical protein
MPPLHPGTSASGGEGPDPWQHPETNGYSGDGKRLEVEGTTATNDTGVTVVGLGASASASIVQGPLVLHRVSLCA